MMGKSTVLCKGYGNVANFAPPPTPPCWPNCQLFDWPLAKTGKFQVSSG